MYRILIVDDEQAERDGVESLIRCRYPSIEPVKASNGKVAWDIWQQQSIDIVFADIKMPLMNGIELCQRIRNQSSSVILIVLSAYADFEYTKKAIQISIDDYLLKPISIEEFNSVLDNAFDTLAKRSGADERLLSVLGPVHYRVSERSDDGISDCRIIAKVMQCVEDSFSENIGLEWAAEKVQLSPGYLSSLFKNTYGKSFTQYLINVRLEKAAELLNKTNLRIVEIGETVGYINASHFCMQFRKQYGMTPNQFRQKGIRF